MTYTVLDIEKEADKILLMMQSGELVEGCSMSALQTPATEAWETATRLSENCTLSSDQKNELILNLDKDVRTQLETTNYDDFDLIYARLLQLIASR